MKAPSPMARREASRILGFLSVLLGGGIILDGEQQLAGSALIALGAWLMAATSWRYTDGPAS